MDGEMTDRETERLDYIQNVAHRFINSLIPNPAERSDEYDNDLIDRLLETVWDGIKGRVSCSEDEFYPYRDTDGDEDGGDDPSVDCYDFIWKKGLDPEEDPLLCKCCECCGNQRRGKCSLGIGA